MKYEILRLVIYKTLYVAPDPNKAVSINELNRFFTMANDIFNDWDGSKTVDQNVNDGMIDYFKKLAK